MAPDKDEYCTQLLMTANAGVVCHQSARAPTEELNRFKMGVFDARQEEVFASPDVP